MVEKSTDSTWSLDREIVLTRVFDAPRDLVFRAWTEPEHLTAWFGPKDYTTTTRDIDLRVGGAWRFDMIAANGTRYTNRIVFREIRSPDLLVFDHGSDVDDDPNQFHVTITFDEQSNGKTVVTMRQLHPTKERRAWAIGFGAVEIGFTTMDKLSEYLRRR